MRDGRSADMKPAAIATRASTAADRPAPRVESFELIEQSFGKTPQPHAPPSQKAAPMSEQPTIVW
jgi:hypothetical protein